MGRSAVLSGRIDARDRAKLRHRRDRVAAPEADPYSDIWSWLKQEPKLADLEPKEAMRLDLGDYLSRTGHLEIEGGERLRQLAMHLETAIGFDATGLDALDRIYQEAARLSPESSEVWQSRGISAMYVVQVHKDPELIDRARKIAEQSLHKAWALDPNDPLIAHSIGLFHYEFRSPDSEALKWFERAIELDPNHGDARLYRAHCLHDDKQWSAAVSAYESVPLDWFKGPQAWMVDVVLEAQAYCRLRSGERVGALDEFRRLLERLIKEPKRCLPLLLGYVKEACEGELREELSPLWAALQRLIDEGAMLA